MIFFLILELLSLKIISGEQCEHILCSNIIDYVCGMVKSEGTTNVTKYQNICHLEKIRCRLKGNADVSQVPDELCGLKKEILISRRETDFSIVGGHQACNHSCPTYCADIYDPACAQIWNRNKTQKSNRVMVNHCHIDLFSCVVGVNVTILPLAKCYVNGNNIIFMKQVAALKSLHLRPNRRRSNSEGSTEWSPQYVSHKITLNNTMREDQEAGILPFLRKSLENYLLNI